MRWRSYHAKRNSFYLAAILMLTVILYAICSYPVYTGSKTRTMYRLYKELEQMELKKLDADDIEILNEFQKDKFEISVADEQMELVYTSKNEVEEDYVERRFKSRLELYTEQSEVVRRSLESRQVLVLRRKLMQNQNTYYIYIKKDVQSGKEIIDGTTLYFAAMVILVLVLYYALEKRKEKMKEGQLKKSNYQLLESQREFVANISHELKTPLAVVSSQLELLEIAADNIDRPYYYASIREELEKMSKMVGELLDFSMLDNQLSAMEMSRVNLTEIVRYLLLRYDAMFQKNEIKLEQQLEKDCYVNGNRKYLERAVNNYLMNAFQHTQQGKQMSVTLTKEKQDLKLAVYNEGDLIEADRMEQIWDSFYTSSRKKKPTANDAGNIGLGLYVVRKIVETHKGTCGVENQENGVQFWMLLPEWKN